MSLEAQIAELNANIKTLVNVLNSRVLNEALPTNELKKATTPAPEKTVEKTVPAAAPTAAPAAVDALDYEKDVKPKVLEVSSRKGRDACMAVLGKFGLASAKAAKPEQYADIIKACEEALK